MTAPTEQLVTRGDFVFCVPAPWQPASHGWIGPGDGLQLVVTAERIPRASGELGLCVRKYAVGRLAAATKDVKGSKMGTPSYEESDALVFASCSAFLGDGFMGVTVAGHACSATEYALLSVVVIRDGETDPADETSRALAEIVESIQPKSAQH